MKIKPHEISVAELAADYVNDLSDNSVVGYGGKLDIRPPYQRAFVYKPPQRDAVIDTLHKEHPLNVMYWSDCGDGNYEVLDGQQRTISICEFVADRFSCTGLFGRTEPFNFSSLEEREQRQILNYKLMVYICAGDEREKLDWFETVNIAGEKLTKQELRNAVYHGAWVSSAREYFSKPGGGASYIGGGYLSGKPIRQEYLQSAIQWIGYAKEQSIEEYMSAMRQQPNAGELCAYFETVIAWVKKLFPNRREQMRTPDWGRLYHAHGKRTDLDAKKLEVKVAKLMRDDDVTKKAGIYEYVLSGDEHALNIRAFTDNQKATAYAKQKGRCNNKKCPDAKKKFELGEMQGDHIKPWSKGGKTEPGNLQMLCSKCNARKSNK